MESNILKYVDDLQADADKYLDAKERLEKRLDRPVLISLHFVYRDEMPAEAEEIASKHGLAPYTHMESELECFPWNLSTIFGTHNEATPDQLIPLFRTRRENTLRGPRMANLYPRYGDDGKPVDFHFLENYHHRTIERSNWTPWESETVWWPNIVVRLGEVYNVMNKIGENSPIGEMKFFGFLSRPYIHLQEYWILIHDKSVGVPEGIETSQYWDEELGDIDEAYESQELYIKEAIDIYEQRMGRDAIMKTPEDLVAVDDVETLSDRDKRRLRKVAQCLRNWGARVPVIPRVVRWAVQGERNHNMPPTIFEIVDQLNPERSCNHIGPRTFPDITFH
ncbi:uncharacterized protein GGS22DRAFT_193405 [Annulohypoxylon maeteangense]|uniref:uncharacterized protein n=1 Tax=Annulohypoxylon maeteangense TaxID=1927788 RepID=UPI002007FAC2|nr:uncharacterized protein GGS22DRAFT_193405 [Annulohypoxylon maeteangense]KAI0880343.1 hypothetical protein GGS22DRAFT_193405 [Annulohypoxylon maeteangense]